MTALNGETDALAVVRYNQDAIAEIAQCVQDGVYCALLGPRLSGKTELLRHVAQMLADSPTPDLHLHRPLCYPGFHPAAVLC